MYRVLKLSGLTYCRINFTICLHMAGEDPEAKFSFVPDEELAQQIKAEAIIEGCDPGKIVSRALALYMHAVPEMRAGAKLLLARRPNSMDTPAAEDDEYIWGAQNVEEVVWPPVTPGESPEQPGQ